MSLRDKLVVEALAAREALACEAVIRADHLYPELLETLRKEAAQGKRTAYVNVPKDNLSPAMRRAIATALLVRLRAEGLTTAREVMGEEMDRSYAYKVSW